MICATKALPIVLGCHDSLKARVRYVFDTLLMAANLDVAYVAQPPEHGPWLWYGSDRPYGGAHARGASVVHSRAAWDRIDDHVDVIEPRLIGDVHAVLPGGQPGACEFSVNFDLVANAFYFLSSHSEKTGQQAASTRGLYSESVFARHHIPQDVVDKYVALLCESINEVRGGVASPSSRQCWPGGATYAVVLSHDVDFLPRGSWDYAVQGVKSIARHLIKERDIGETARAAGGLWRAFVQRTDPYGCVPQIIAAEKQAGVCSSFQVAVGHRHPLDVNYHVTDDAVRDYLRVILDEGFDLCLHGSYRSTERMEWYSEEVDLLTSRLARPHGSRQHFLSFSFDALFTAQEKNGILYDMSMGFPDRTGPRAGFSYPYFPYCLAAERPYDVVQLGLSIMDVTLRGYLGLKDREAWAVIKDELDLLRSKGGCASIVWHPIVFGEARDPGYGRLYWKLVEYVQANGGLATDGRTINRFWRARASRYTSFHNCRVAAQADS